MRRGIIWEMGCGSCLWVENRVYYGLERGLSGMAVRAQQAVSMRNQQVYDDFVARAGIVTSL